MISTDVLNGPNGAGDVGQYLKERLSPYNLTSFDSMSFPDQISFVYKPSWDGLKPTPLARAALSYTRASVPVQVFLPPEELRRLIVSTNPVPYFDPIVRRPDVLIKKKESSTLFPYKPFPHAITKANVHLHEVGCDAWRLDKNFCFELLPYLLYLSRVGDITNDRATAFVMYAWAIRGTIDDACRWAAAVTAHPTYAKDISNFVKAIGTNGSALGAMLVEGDTLLGRGVGALDLRSEARRRCDLAYIREHMLAEFPEPVLASAINRILDLEIVSRNGSQVLSYPTLSEHWDSRWVWAVNGSHSASVDKWVRPGHVKHPDIFRYHRRAWLEEIEEDPRLRWDGTTNVSASPKLEHGKTRAIFACDTVNYLAFEHLMATVEKSWRGQRVILNPGKGGHLGMAERVARNRGRAGVSLMLDYDDFNSHHSTQSMQLVIRLLCERTGYPPDLQANLIKSLERHVISVGGKHIGTAAGTLMSGHRCTTFFNSVLNMAYLMVVLGESWLLQRPSLHVGDDVYLGVLSYADAGYVTDRVMSSRLRMNRRKQSVGHVSTEFLRVASAGRDSFGYLARSISSIVSGNWVADAILDPFEALTSMVASARTYANRGHSPSAPLLLRSAIKRTLGKSTIDDATLEQILCGELAINNGPMFKSSGTYRYVEIRPSAIKRDRHGYAPLKLNATHSFLSKCATELEVGILARAGVSVERDMERSSYSKTLRFDVSYFEQLLVSEVRSSPIMGSVTAESLLKTPSPRGLLTEYPLLTLAKHRLPEHLVREALGAVGGNPKTQQLELDAWGEYRHGCVINTVLSYSDAATLGKRTSVSVLTSTRRCYV